MSYVPTPDRLEFKQLAEILTARIDEMTFREQCYVALQLILWLKDEDETTELPIAQFRAIVRRLEANKN